MTDAIEHPYWCDLSRCTATHTDSRHLGRVHKIDAAAIGDVEIALHVSSNGDDSVAEAPVSLEMQLIRSLGLSVEGYSFNAEAVIKLHALLGRLIPAFTAHA